MIPKPSSKLTGLPPYIFVKLNQIKDKARAAGRDLIDLSMGNPDRPTPDHVVEALCRAAREDKSTHRYPQTRGLPEFRRAVAAFYKNRFDVDLDPETEIVPLIGSKEGLAHLCMAYLGPKDAALVPSPCYPVHFNGPFLAGSKSELMPLTEENKFLPDLGKISAAAARRSRFMILNYPNNPTGAVVEDDSLFKEALKFAKRHEMFVLHDNAYSEIAFDGYRAPSFLQVPGSKKLGVEFHSLSKSYSMAGWRIAFAVGNAEIIQALTKLKSHLDYGAPGFVQKAAVEALNGPQDCVREITEVYRRRRDVLCESLNAAGWAVEKPKAAMYLWARLPAAWRRKGSMAFAEKLIMQAGVAVTPGIGFGPDGEGYVRFAFVENEDKIREAVRRIGAFLGTAPAAAPAARPAVLVH